MKAQELCVRCRSVFDCQYETQHRKHDYQQRRVCGSLPLGISNMAKVSAWGTEDGAKNVSRLFACPEIPTVLKC